MRFSLPNWQSLTNIAVKRLNFDSQCAICARITGSQVDFCDDCEGLLQRCLHTDPLGQVTHLCPGCGASLPGGTDTGCPHCQDAAHGPGRLFRRIVVPYRYAFPVDRLIQDLKYRDQRALARVFGTLLARAVRESSLPAGCTLPSHLIPVPLHASRSRTRGYNQSADIARWCAHALGLQACSRAAVREIDTGSLAGLSRAERQHRILGAFRADERMAGLHVAIVDDVLTSGSTARELARELYDTGVLSVELWVLARTSSSR